mmetsp:Transcript_8745/g.12304  ORF Transcript_8745/g.12304 Transcript_8745/m.12304 type:complete len:145 (+) Transcript_8745:223-657(+)
MNPSEIKATDCVFYTTSTCQKGQSCPWRHNAAAAHSSHVCPIWAGFGWCDGRCNKQHPSDPSKPISKQNDVNQRQEIACRFHAEGRCTKGGKCPFKHEEYEARSLHEAAQSINESDTMNLLKLNDGDETGKEILNRHSMSHLIG